MSTKLKTKKKLDFEILHDEGNAVAATYGLRHVVPDDVVEVYRSFGIDLPRSNGETSQSLPMAARYVLDRSGRVVAADVNADYTKRPEPDASLEVVRALESSSS